MIINPFINNRCHDCFVHKKDLQFEIESFFVSSLNSETMSKTRRLSKAEIEEIASRLTVFLPGAMYMLKDGRIGTLKFIGQTMVYYINYNRIYLNIFEYI